MKTKLWLAVSLLAACFYTTAASAEIVIGAKAGSVDYDVSGSDPGVNGSLQLAFDLFDLGVADIALEGEFSTSLSDGELGGADVSFESTGLYAALRTAGPVYLIARAGYASTEVEFEDGSTTDDDGVATGLGVGFSVGLRMEIEHTTYEIEDTDINYLTLGFAF
ncbi:MAG TPA: hypothetical protein VGL10_00310 [Gammaproteobacteria bacterium]